MRRTRTSRAARQGTPTPIGSGTAALLFFIAASMLYTYPLFFLPKGNIFGLHEDITRALHFFWCLQHNGDWLYSGHFWPQLNAPFGWDVPNTPQYLLWWAGAALSRWWDPTVPTNILIALSFPLGGFFFYLLARRMTGSQTAAFLGGFLFAFSPFHFSKAEAYPAIAGIQWIPLYGWALLRYFGQPRWKNAFIVGGAYTLVLNFSLVNGYIAALGAVLVAGARWVHRWVGERDWNTPNWKEIGQLGAAHLPAFAGILLYLAIRELPKEGVELLSREPNPVSLRLGTVQAFHFLMPTYYHPWWGATVHRWMIAVKPGTWILDDMVSPGYVAWSLGLAGLVFLFRQGRSRKWNAWWVVAGLTTVSAVLCLDPFIGGRLWPLPNTWLYNLYPTFRNFSRFGLLFSLGICLLAALGFSFATRRLGAGTRRLAAAALFLAAGFELYYPVQDNILAPPATPPVYSWLRAQPEEFIVAEYPMVTQHIQFEASYLFWQMYHEKRLVNSDYSWSPGERLRKTLVDFQAPKTLETLKRLGVRYLAVHKYHYIADRYPGLNPRELNVRMTLPKRLAGARLIEEWDDAGLYTIDGTALPGRGP